MEKGDEIPEGTCSGCEVPLNHCYNSCLLGIHHQFVVDVSIPALDIVLQIMNSSLDEGEGPNYLITLAVKNNLIIDFVRNNFNDNPDSVCLLMQMLDLRYILRTFACDVNGLVEDTDEVETEEEMER